MVRFIRRLSREQRGVAAVEYALLAAIIAIGISTAASNLGKNISSTFTTIGTKLTTAIAG
jgi:pilus assembly protein Flp/PilA